jgi:hypothetical protein
MSKKKRESGGEPDREEIRRQINLRILKMQNRLAGQDMSILTVELQLPFTREERQLVERAAARRGIKSESLLLDMLEYRISEVYFGALADLKQREAHLN